MNRKSKPRYALLFFVILLVTLVPVALNFDKILAALGGSDATPAAHWSFDEGVDNTCSGGTNDACDKSGNGNDGAFSGATWQPEENCISGNCVLLNGSSTVTAADSASLSVTGDLTLGGWIKPLANTASTEYTIAAKGTDYELAQYGDEVRMYIGSSSNYETTDTANLQTNTWYHVIGVYDASGQTVSIYVNGVLQDSTTTGTIPGSISDGSDQFVFSVVPTTLTRSNEVSSYSTGTYGTGSFTTASFTPPNNSLLVAFIHGMDDNQGQDIEACLTISDSETLSWTSRISGGQVGGYSEGFRVWTAPVTTGTSMTVTADCGAVNMWGYAVDVFAYTNYDTTSPIGATATDDTTLPTDGAQSITLSASPATTSEVLAVLSSESDGTQTVTPGTGWTEIVENRINNATNMQQIQYRNNSTSTSVSWNDIQTSAGTVYSTEFGALEIQAAPSGNAFNGYIDEFKVFDSALTASQIKAEHAGGAAVLGATTNEYAFLNEGLVGYWPMDDGDIDSHACDLGGSGDTCDQSGSNNHATDEGTMTDGDYEAGKYLSSLDFDGTNDALNINKDYGFDTNNTFTFATWVYFDSVTSWQTMIGQDTTDFSNYAAFYFQKTTNSSATCGRTNNSFTIILPQSGTDCDFQIAESTTTAAISTWYHLAATYDGQKLRMYVNGQLEDETTTSVSVASQTGNLHLGTGYYADNASDFVNGKLDETRIYSRSLSPSEIQKLYSWAPGPVVHLKLDENTGTSTVYDSSGNSLNGTLGGTMTSNDWVVGKFGSALDLDGTDDKITITDTAKLDITGGVTIAGWFNGSANAVSGGTPTFSDDYETNDFSAWDTTSSSSFTQSTGAYNKNGTYGAQFDANNGAGDNSSQTYIQDNFTFSGTTNTVYLHTWFQYNDMTTAGYELVGSKATMAILDGSGNRMAWLIAGNNGGNGSLRLVYRSKAGTDTFAGSEVTLTDGTWYEVTLAIDKSGANPVVQWWLDGSSQASATDSSSGSDGLGRTPGQARFGVIQIVNWERADYTIWMDDTGVYDDSPFGSGSTTLFGKGRDSYQLELSDTTITGYLNTSQTITGTFTNNQWQHIAMTYDGAAHNLYIDGTLVTSEAYTTAIGTNATGITIGDVFLGKIDDLKIYNYGRTAQQIVEDMNAGHPTGGSPVGSQVSYWKLDDLSGTTASDHIASSGHDATLTNSPAWTASGKVNGGIDFEADNSTYLTTPDTSSLSITGDLTISAWINPESTTASTRFPIVGKGTDYQLVQFGDEIRMYIGSASNYETTDSVNLQTGTWYHVLGSYDASAQTVTIYINGAPVDSTTTGTIPSSISDGTTSLYIGAAGDGATQEFQIAATTEDGIETNNTTWDDTPVPTVTGFGYYDGVYYDVEAGLRFNNITIDNAETISDAYLSVYADTANGAGSVTSVFGKIYADDVDDAAAWGTSSRPSQITTTTASVDWDPSTWTNNTWVNSPDISTVIQEIVNRGSWASGNDLRIAIWNDGTTGQNVVAFEDYDTSSSLAAKLTISTGSTQYYDGIIDEVKLYSSALTADQALIDYNAGSSVSFGVGTDEKSTSYGGPGGDPPVVHLPLDENSGGDGATVYDKSGNGYNGTINFAGTRTAGWTPGKYGSAINFTGSSDGAGTGDFSYVEFSDDALDSLTEGSISFWMKAADTGDTWQNMFAVTDGGSFTETLEIAFDSANNQIDLWSSGCGGLEVSGANGFDIPGTVTDWHHVVYAESSTGHTIYIDGRPIAVTGSYNSGSSSSTCFFDEIATGTTNYAIGQAKVATNQGYEGEDYIGLIDEFKIFDYALSASQVAYEYNRGTPIGWYKMDECTGTTIYNNAKNSNGEAGGNNGTLTLGASGTTSAGTCTTSGAWANGASGKLNASMDFDGSDDYITLGSPAAYDDMSAFTIAAWIYPTGWGEGSYGRIIDKDGANDLSFLLYNGASENSIQLFRGRTTTDAQANAANNSISLNQWQHVAGVFDQTTNTIQIFIDGQEVSYATQEGGSGNLDSDAADTLYIGNNAATTRTFDGQIDDLRIYNYPLSQAQIEKIMLGGKAGSAASFSNQVSLRAFCHCVDPELVVEGRSNPASLP